ncbi:hypothetical protein DNTS_024694, partial [Danionella cerebrum]
AQVENDGSTVEALQRKIRKLELELDRKSLSEPADKKSILKEDKLSKEEFVRWNEGKKWQARVEKVRNLLKDKEKEVESLSKQLTTVKELYSRLELEKVGLQRKLKGRGVTADLVVGARTLEADKQIEELQTQNTQLEQQIKDIKQQQALPRDAAMEDIIIRNRFLEEKLHSLESHLTKEPASRPSDKHAASPSQLSCSSKVHSLTFDISEAEEMHSLTNGLNKVTSEDEAEHKDLMKDDNKDASANEIRQSPDAIESQHAELEDEVDEELKSHQERIEEALGDQLDGEIDSEASKVQLDEEQEFKITESLKCQPSAGSKELVEEVAHSNSTSDAKLMPEPPTMAEAYNLETELSEHVRCSSSSQELNLNEAEKELIDLGVLKTGVILRCDKEQAAQIKDQKTSGRGSETPSQREHELQKENLKLSSENLELRLQLEQANKDLPRLKDQVADLKEMCSVLKKEKAEVDKRLNHIRGTGRSGKTIPELEKTIALMKKVVEKVQKENETLKKTTELEYEKLKASHEEQLNIRLESKTKSIEKIMMENERLRKDNKKETEAAEKLKVAKASLEVANEKLKAELEETNGRLLFAQSHGSSLQGADSKAWKSLFENKMKGLESEITKKNSSISELNVLLKDTNEKLQTSQHTVIQLKEQVELLKNIPLEATSDEGLAREYQSVRLANKQLEREKAQLLRQIQRFDEQFGTSKVPGYKELQEQIKAVNRDKKKLQEEVKRLTRELENFDPVFFEELEDLKFNYNLEVKKNIVLEEELKKLSDQFGVALPVDVSIS